MSDLGEVDEGDVVDATLAVRRVDEPNAYDGGHVLRLELGDASGSLPAKLWLGPDGERAREVADALEPGEVVDVQAPVRAYRGRLELNLETPPEPAEDWDPAALLPSTDAHVGRRLHRCLRAARSIDDDALRRVVLHVWTDEATREAIARSPATKRRHRAHLGGWIEHVHAELALAETLLELHAELDRDLLVAGVLLHDVGRLDAYRAEAAIDLTQEGRLLGTAALADARLEAALDACGVDGDRALHLRHMVLSHAGRPDWGAPVEPATPEAIALHAIESLDTRLARALEVVADRRERGRLAGYSKRLNRHLELADPLAIPTPAEPEPDLDTAASRPAPA
jgi:3'-5' exoribonuclease